MRIGQGTDVHKLTSGHELTLGGIRIPCDYELVGHSDGDVLIHAIMDALFGALSLGDIGDHYPDSDDALQGIDSKVLLKDCYQKILGEGYRLVNLDSVVMAERPKLAPYIPKMEQKLADVMGVSKGQISVKATTWEGLGFVGRGEGMMAEAVVFVEAIP